jgi:excisionase family DNA binding protein
MDEVLTIRDVAGRLKMAERTVYAMVADGELPAFKVRGQWRVRESAFEAWLDELSGAQGAGRSSGRDAATEPPGPNREMMMATASDELPVSKLTERVSLNDLHTRLLSALGRRVLWAGPIDRKPLEVDLSSPVPARVRVYMYNATRPPGGRPLGEHKVQLIVPGQSRGQRASFDHGDGRMVLLIGYAAEEDVFILWDAGLYNDFAWSRNVQVKAETIIQATAGRIATQFRQLRPGGSEEALETVIAAPAERLAEAVDRRIQLTRDRVSRA